MNSQTTTMMTNAPTVFGAAEEGDAAAVARLLASGAKADERAKPGGETPLMRAALRGHEDVVRVLLDAGADACARRADGFTPLILAVFFGHEAVARLLIERGADASASTNLGTTAARWAEARGFASMAEALREAEASRPRAAVSAAVERGEADRANESWTKPSDEVEIFSKGRGGAGREERSDAGREQRSEGSPLPARDAEEAGYSSNATPSGVTVRRGGQLPAHPSAGAFRVGDFLRSWQGSLGALLLVAALGVAVFALMRGNNAPRNAAQPSPAQAAPQAAAQQPAVPLPPAPMPSPAGFPTPDPQGIMPVPEQGYPVPNASGQPYYVTTGPVAPVSSDAPRDLTVVSEGGGAPAPEAGQPVRRAGTNDSAPARNDNASAPTPTPRPARTPEPEQQRPAPANQTPPPAPQPTPGRAKVIPWPPQ